MNTRPARCDRRWFTLARRALLLVASCWAGGVTLAQPITSAFTYQGELASAGVPVTGVYDVRFRLYDAATAGNQIGDTLCSDNLSVSNGRFAASLDFGAAAFAGQRRLLEIEVRADGGLDCSDQTGYTVLTPRHELTAVPNANFAQSAATASTAASAQTATNAASFNGQPPSFYQNAANLTGTLADGQLSSNIARLNGDQIFTGQLNLSNSGNRFAGNGAGVTNLNATNVSAGVLDAARMPTNWAAGGDTCPNLSVAGSLAKGGGSFKIDHPLDPENKYLYHSFVESPDMMNIYNGNVTTDASGYAIITLPDYFDALNRDFRYQLTVVDENAPDVHFVRVASKVGTVSQNQFMIKSTPGNLEVSWQVTGIRQDAWAQKNRIPNSVDKPAAEKGTLLHPEAFGKPADQGIMAPPAAAAAPVNN